MENATMIQGQVKTVKDINKQITQQIRWKSRLANWNKQLFEGSTVEELGLNQTQTDIFEKNKFQSRNKYGREFDMFDRKLTGKAERKIRSLQKEKAILTATALRDAILDHVPGIDSHEGFRFALEQAQEFLKRPAASDEKSEN